MANQKYEIEKHSVETVLSWIKTKEVVIPEIQRPFVWKATQVRDLIDSLYNGYPVGYLIVSRSHEMRLKDGTMSKGQRILIDGQQRVTALMASILGMSVLNNQYKKRTIRIAYNPFVKDDENLFEVQDQSHLKSKKWIEDISIFFNDEFDDYTFIEDFCSVNPEMDRRELNRKIKKIIDIKTKDLVSLLSGRDFETRDYKEEIAEESFSKLTEGIKHFMHQYYFEQFILAIKSAGFINSKLINSQNALDFSYVVYLKLALSGEVDKTKIKRCVAKWFTMSILTGRYSSSPETRMDQDIRNINDKGVINYLNEIENAELSDAFWDFGLPQKLDTPNSTAPALSTFFAAQIVKGDKGLFSPNSSVRDLFGVSDVHHIFPKDYLKKTEFLDNRSIYNQVANYTYLDTPINIAVGNKEPNVYFKEAFESALKDGIVYGNHMSVDELKSNLIENCIPLDIVNWDYNDYRNKFLVERRKLMAKKIKEYYNNL